MKPGILSVLTASDYTYQIINSIEGNKDLLPEQEKRRYSNVIRHPKDHIAKQP
ncbi:MAG: hypothetical protein ACR2PX_03845 [Endozoicomonas sp.]